MRSLQTVFVLLDGDTLALPTTKMKAASCFCPAEMAVRAKLEAPRKLYGRELHVEALQQAFFRSYVASGVDARPELVLIEYVAC